MRGRVLFSVLLLSAALSIFAGSALADGGMVPVRPIGGEYVPRPIYEPEQKAAIFYNHGKEDMILQARYDAGEATEFAWIIPTPNYPILTKGDETVFLELEDFLGYGRGWIMAPMALGAAKSAESVTVHEERGIGPYTVAVISSESPNAISEWLNNNGYAFPAEHADVLTHYTSKGWYFTAIRVNSAELETNRGTAAALSQGKLQPVKLSFFSDEMIYPLKISSINADDASRRTSITIYAVTDLPVEADNFYVSREKQITPQEAESYTALSKYIPRTMQVTKLTASLPAFKMNKDVSLVPSLLGMALVDSAIIFVALFLSVIVLAVLYMEKKFIKTKTQVVLYSAGIGAGLLVLLILISFLPMLSGTLEVGQAKADYLAYKGAMDSGTAASCSAISNADLQQLCADSFRVMNTCSGISDKPKRDACYDNLGVYYGS
ncbi:MAG: DUF2330 domain-containing protein [Candidatus Diapherotrites archaeon]